MADLPKIEEHEDDLAYEIELFDHAPVRILQAFLFCFDQDGNQRYEIPGHVLKALAECFARFMDGKAKIRSLDVVFGGRVARQRNEVLEEQNKLAAVNAVLGRIFDMRKGARKKNLAGTPYEIAIAEAAIELGLSEDSIKKKLRGFKTG